ncbi:hypothetical protein M409DRAFT_64632 [Zasmidium cellare ATCC 36951]|uniref:Major facilitator superfamily (MFS) profile domain-containing protein n=1 Tax=Zasmidium cellare ATCC 36951 TaxID=1080233 RepID=A0A6A6CUL4_ZASCE|nr:uncharacterized protein M409DRAFT_64632 [Zasmidium cellare ATCC 36951]KAF2169512.1 hypothetical protein M409DRAFT_64632 [Zasmidium cellare ATCC 36951]
MASPLQRSTNIPLLHFRSVFTQIFLISATAFCTVGSFNALQGLGGAGQETPYVANAATAINFGLLGVVCILAGPVVNLLDIRWSLFLGTCGDPIFGAAVYCNTRYGIQWFLIFAAVVRGACSGLFWAAEGSVIIAYPRDQHRGKSITLWVFAKELGSVASSAINLGLSARDDKPGHVGYPVYYATITIICCGIPLALLMSPTHKVRHRDGTKLDASNAGKYGLEYRRLGNLLRKKEVLLLVPYAWFAYFYYSFSHTFVAKRFTVRARALTSLLTSLASILGSAIIAVLSDSRLSSKAPLALLTTLVLSLCGGGWIYFAYIAITSDSKHKLDWAGPGYAKQAMAVAIIFMVMQAAQTYLYWSAATFSTSVRDRFHMAGVVRGVESLGQCVAYGVNSSSTKPTISVGLNLGFYVLATAFTLGSLIAQM